MHNDAEERVASFYSTVGWETTDGIAEDTRRWEDLRPCARSYVSLCRLRVLRHVPESGDRLLDMASGAIPFDEYLEYSKNFKTRYCVDLSATALEAARARIGDHGVFLHGSFFDLEFEDDFFDCTISLHTIYHIDKDRQEEAVRKLIRVTRPGRPIIIVYSNPGTLLNGLLWPVRRVVRLARRVLRRGPASELYFHPHPNRWWKRFADEAEIEILPWRSFAASTQKRLVPDNRLGTRMLTTLFRLEDRFPRFFARFFQYPMIVMKKKQGGEAGVGLEF